MAAGSGPGTSSGTLVLLGNGAGGFHLQVDDSPVAGVTSFPTAVAIGRFNADPYGDVLATRGVPIRWAARTSAARLVSSSATTTAA